MDEVNPRDRTGNGNDATGVNIDSSNIVSGTPSNLSCALSATGTEYLYADMDEQTEYSIIMNKNISSSTSNYAGLFSTNITISPSAGRGIYLLIV